MVDDEVYNIEELEREESLLTPEALIDVAFEQVAFLNILSDWSLTSLTPFGGTLKEPSRNS